jgi:hypothetical protein
MGAESTYGRGQLRRTPYSPWPARPVPLPPTEGPSWRVEAIDSVGGLQLVPPGQGWKPAPVPLPDEWVLRKLPRLDLDDPATFVGLVETYGNLVPTRPDWDEPFVLLPEELALYDAQDQADFLNAIRGHDREILRHGEVVSFALVQVHFALLKSLVAHVVAYQRRRRLASAWAGWEDSDGEPISDAVGAWQVFGQALNAALQPFSVQVATPYDHPSRRQPPLYAIAALQIFNILVEGLPVLTCANEPCHQDFQRQLGRAAKGQYRTSGVMFCSHQCADAQRQRERRHRQRKGKK